MVIWSAILQATAGAVIPPVLIVGLIFLAFIPILNAARPRSGLALAVVTVAAIAGNLPIIIDELSHPDSAPGFILTLLSTVAPVVGVLAGIAAWRSWPSGAARTLVLAGIGVFVSGTAASLVIAAGTESPGALINDVRISASQIEFDPAVIEVPANASGVWIENRDGVRHTFTVEELGIDLEVPALKAGRVDVEGPAGSYEVTCKVPGHEAMTGTLTISS